jgi:Dolichyl-phosphate-mannose-protein mannosyltransferase
MFTKLLSKDYPYHLHLLIAAGIFFFLPFLGSVHLFDWDEINFAESAREMLVTKNYTQVQINFKPFWEKPPFFFWLQALSMKAFGINAFAARLPNALFGILTLVVFYLIGKKMYDGRFGFLWALSYLGSFLPHLYFKSAIIDPVFNFFIFLSIYFLFQTIQNYKQPKDKYLALLAGCFAGIAILTKGPVGLLLIGLTISIYWTLQGFKAICSKLSILLFTVAMILVSSAWYGLEIIKNGWWFFETFINYQIRLLTTADAGHEQPFYYHFLVVFIGCFPLSAFALKSLFKAEQNDNSGQLAFRKMMLYLFWVVMIVFTIVKTKIAHYSSMAYFPLSFLSAYTLYYFLEKQQRPQKFVFILLYVFGGLFSLILISLPILAYFKTSLYPYIKDPFARMCLSTDVHWGGWEFLIGLLYLILIVIGIRKIYKMQLANGIISLFFAAAFCLWGYLAIIVPKIEAYSQNPAIAFYEDLKGKPVYAFPLWHISYAHYFYFQIPKYNKEEAYSRTGHLDRDWLLTGDIDLPVYFVIKTSSMERMQLEHPNIHLVKVNGGFALYKRELMKDSLR